MDVTEPEEDLDQHGPRCEFGAFGPFKVLCPPEIGDLTGLALVCKDRSCTARTVHFHGQLSAPGDDADAPAPDAEVDLEIHIDAGYAINVGESTNDRAEAAAEWLTDNVPGLLLDVLHERALEARGEALDPDAWRRRDWSWWLPGKVIAWREVAPDGRVDLYVAHGRGYAATDYYCANPSCDCGEVQVVFGLPDGTGSGELHKVGAVTLAFQGESRSTVSELAPDHTEEQLAALGAHFLRRHGRERLAERMRRVREVGVEVLRRRAASGGGALPGGSGKVGRNERCPCGSGKKFKKCCGAG